MVRLPHKGGRAVFILRDLILLLMEQDRYYHIYNRGNNSDTLFYEDKNYDYFIKKYRFYLDKYVDTLCFCLMKTHFHLLVKIKDIPFDYSVTEKKTLLTPLEKAFKDFFISYAKSINKKYGRTGSLFQTKFKRKEITDNFYLKNAIKYIHFNPVVAGLCFKPESYAHSSYSFILQKDNSWLAADTVIEIFGDLDAFKSFHHHLSDSDFSDFRSFENF